MPKLQANEETRKKIKNDFCSIVERKYEINADYISDEGKDEYELTAIMLNFLGYCAVPVSVDKIQEAFEKYITFMTYYGLLYGVLNGKLLFKYNETSKEYE